MARFTRLEIGQVSSAVETKDWEEVMPAGTLTNLDLSAASNWGPDRQSPEDFVMRMFMAWHDGSQQLYLGFEIVDDLSHVWNAEVFADAELVGCTQFVGPNQGGLRVTSTNATKAAT